MLHDENLPHITHCAFIYTKEYTQQELTLIICGLKMLYNLWSSITFTVIITNTHNDGTNTVETTMQLVSIEIFFQTGCMIPIHLLCITQLKINMHHLSLIYS